MIRLYKKSLSRTFIDRFTIVFLLLVIAVSLDFPNVYASESIDRRLQISLSIFPKIVAVDNGIRDKLNKKNQVLLAFLSQSDKTKPRELAKVLKSKIKNIAGMPYKLVSINVNGILAKASFSPTAIFLTERLSPKSFNKVMDFAMRKQILVFSPFTGDVERGASVGIMITSRVKPYFNIRTLKASSISINPLLMKMSKRYE